MADNNWLTDMLDTPFTLTGATRMIREYRDRDGATWYRLAEDEVPSPQVAEWREVQQREIEQAAADGTVRRYWATQEQRSTWLDQRSLLVQVSEALLDETEALAAAGTCRHCGKVLDACAFWDSLHRVSAAAAREAERGADLT